MGSPFVIDLVDDSDDDEPEKQPPIVPRTRVLGDNVVEILEDDDDSDEEDRKPAAVSQKKRKEPPSGAGRSNNEENVPMQGALPNLTAESHAAAAPLGNRAETNSRKRKSTDSDIEVLAEAPHAAFVPAAVANNNSDDDDVELLGSVGQNALVDFPHARENCVINPFEVDPRKHCPNCFCFVCDAEASKCESWDSHHKATYNDPHWRRLREQKKLQRHAPAVAAAPAPVAAMRLPNWAPAPPRPFQRPDTNRVPIQDLLSAVTRVYPREVSPPAPFCTNLRHYQKQSLAFMMDVEQSDDPTQAWKKGSSPFDIRGGWLASEVGMGKSAIVIALVASDRLANTKQNQRVGGLRPVKTTVIMTSVSLMGQWQDECAKHAPHLKVVRYHRSSGSRLQSYQVPQADIIISTATFKWDPSIVDEFLFHRVVMDESHLFALAPSSAKIDVARAVRSLRRWCVTATPITSSYGELFQQADFLGMPGGKTGELVQNCEHLKGVMIRHEKSQSINGSSALTLPSSTTMVAKITMSAQERTSYTTAVSSNRHLLYDLANNHETKPFNLCNRLLYPLTTPLLKIDSSKLNALKSALLDLRNRDANMRAVIFTQLRPMQQLIQSMVKGMRIPLHSFDGSASAKKRDTSIRKFQSVQERGPAVFVVTLRTGSVGITLTAASHVFLMEPCFNPVEEIQAAGRIHRLGQTKPVQVTKFVYDNSFESNVLTLHKEIEQGRVHFTEKGHMPKAGMRILLDGVV